MDSLWRSVVTFAEHRNLKRAALKLREAGSVSIANQSVPIVPTGPQVTNVTCLFLPTFVRNDQLVQALAPYGKVIDVSYATYHRTATVKTGTRFIRMEMKEANPLPNFLRVAGHRATFDYRGLKRVCRRCRQEGHVRAQCTTGYCDRCGVFGHPTEGCTANCGRCGGTHATVDCTAKRSYSSMVTGNYATDFPALDPGNATRPIAPEAPAVPTVSTVAPPSPPDAAAAAAPPPLPSPPPPAPPEPSPTGSGVTSAEATDSARTAAVIVGDTVYAAWSQASGDGEVSSDSDHLVIDENPAPGGPAETPTDSMDTTTTETPESDSNRLTHEDSKRPLRSSGGWSFPCIELAAPLLALKTTLAILDDHDNPARPLTLYFLGANNRLLGDSLPSPLRPRAETTPAFYRSTADLFDKLSVHVSREEILEAPASRLVERLVVADQPPPPPGTVQPYPWLALTSSTLPDHVTNVTCLFLPTFVRNDQLVQALAPYGKVIDVSYATYHRTATVKTGTRFIRMEMKEANPLPNFLRVAGHRATFDYRGLKRVCRRCRQEGHVRAQCTTGYCDRCGVFGHPTEGCTANCGRCGGTHATVDCTAKRSYSSMVTGNYATDFPALDPGNATRPIAPEAPAVPTVSTVAPPSPPDAAAAAAPPPLPSPPPPAPPEPSPTGSGVTSAEATDSARTAAVIVGDTTYAAWSQASGDGEVSSDSDHLVIDENPAPGGPAETPTDSMDTTTTETPESDSNRLTHEDSKRPPRSSGSRSTDTLPPHPFNLQVRSALFTFFWNNRTELVRRSRLCLPRCEGGWSFPCVELAAPLLALKTTLAILDDHDNPARPLTLYFLGANNRLLGDSLPSPLRPRAETTPALYRSTADLFDKLSVHVSREEILEAPASRLVERLVVADQPPPPPGTVQPYLWLALTSSTLPDHVTNVTCLFLPTFVCNDQLVQALAPYGKVINVSYATYHRTATVKAGTA
ncbi:translation initiation factor IF-2-like [Ixodes scapularis]